jgi:hypothetical protein
MKPLISHATTEGTNRRQEQELKMTLKKGWVCRSRKKTGENCRDVLGRELTCQVSESQARGEG